MSVMVFKDLTIYILKNLRHMGWWSIRHSHLLELTAKKDRNIAVAVLRKAATYSPTNGSTICANRLNFSVRNGKR